MINIKLPNRKSIEIEKAAAYAPSISTSQRYRRSRADSEFARTLGSYLTEKVKDPLKSKRIKRIHLLQRAETDRLRGIATRKLGRYNRRITKRLKLKIRKPRWSYGNKITKQ